MLRKTLLFLARQGWLRRWTERSVLTRRLVARFVAGNNREEATKCAQRLQEIGILATLDHLGENVTSEREADSSLEEALHAIAAVRAKQVPATVSIKLTQFGLDLGSDGCLARVRRLAEAAKATQTGIEVDMESSGYVDRTLDVVRSIHEEYGNVRAVIQAYLYRSGEDIDDLCRRGIPVRLCKGAYLEPASVAFPAKKDVDGNYSRLMRVLLERGTRPALATHDGALIGEARRLARNLALEDGSFEFQMLFGVRRRLQRQLAAQGFPVRVYIPYGEAWYPYFMRRLAERPANLLFLLRQLFKL